MRTFQAYQDTRRVPWMHFSWHALGMLFLLAAIAKSLDAPQFPVAGPDWLSYRPFQTAIIWLEVGIGFWALSGLRRHLLRPILSGIFGLFAIGSMGLAFSGAESCGCFGSYRIHPLLIFLFDFFMILAVWVLPVAEESWQQDKPAASSTAIIAGVAMTGTILSIIALQTTRWAPGEPGFGLRDGILVVLQPRDWLGKPVPILSHIILDKPAKNLGEGDWLIVLHRADCHACRDLIPKLFNWTTSASSVQVALVEIDSGGQRAVMSEVPAQVVNGILDQSAEWFAATPVVFRSRDGIVTWVAETPTDPKIFAPEG